MRSRSLARMPLAAARAALLVWAFMAQGGCDRGQPVRRASPHLYAFLEGYFQSWSSGDMATYRSLFHDQATIVAVVAGRIAYCLGPDEFVQRQAATQGARPMVERMRWVETHEDSIAATARVGWHLTGSGIDVRGVDLFTLLRDPSGAWKITHLLFYQES